MLAFVDSQGHYGRREFLRIGTLGVGGLALPELFAARGYANSTGNPLVRDKSVVFLFLHGGPSQTETFDPKMTAPSGIRSATGEVASTIPGITFGGTFPKLARMANRLIVVRSFVPGDENHDIKPLMGRHTDGANLGSIYARVAGAIHPQTGMPGSAALFPRAVDPSTQPAEMGFGRFTATGSLGERYAPLVPGEGGEFLEDLQLRLPLNRLSDRRSLLDQLDRFRRGVDGQGPWGEIESLRQQALQSILGSVSEAFDLSREDPRTVERYDTAPLVRPEEISRRWNNYENYADNAKTLGKLLLLARRLCERGCGFVTVTTNFVWDMHADENNAGVVEGMDYMGTPLDHAVAAFLEDLEQRGLTNKILLVACGEMGRTPRINAHGGRDHWGRLGPLLLAGGGLPGGQVVGQSSRDAAEPVGDAVTPRNLVATIMHTLFDVGQVRTQRGLPNGLLSVIAGAEPIPGLT